MNGGEKVLVIRIESLKNPDIYRVVQVNDQLTFFDFDTIISTAFMIEEENEIIFYSVRLKGKDNDQFIPLYENDFSTYDSLEETVDDWFVELGDEMKYVNEAGIQLKLTLENMLEIEGLEDSIIEGKGDLFSKRKNIEIDKLNKMLQRERELDELLFEDAANSFAQFLPPDYLTLFQVADELKKLKPWNYFENGDIVAIQLGGMKFFVSVMGAGGQEYGLMMYDEEIGYHSLEKIITGAQSNEDFTVELSALTVNYLDRDELEKDDYELIKEQGLSFRGKKNWISFRTYDPGLFPAHPDFEDVEVMIDLIKAMISITTMRMNGWAYPSVAINEFPFFDVRDDGEIELLGIIQMERLENTTIEIEINDLEIMKVKKKPKSALQAEFDCLYLPFPVSEQGERPIYPLINIIVDHSTGAVLANEVIPFPKHSFVQQQLFWKVLKEMPSLPSKIYVTKETQHILKPLAKLVGIELVVSELPKIKDLKEMLYINPPF